MYDCYIYDNALLPELYPPVYFFTAPVDLKHPCQLAEIMEVFTRCLFDTNKLTRLLLVATILCSVQIFPVLCSPTRGNARVNRQVSRREPNGIESGYHPQNFARAVTAVSNRSKLPSIFAQDCTYTYLWRITQPLSYSIIALFHHQFQHYHPYSDR